MPTNFLLIVIIINIATFLTYAIDKNLAKRKKPRISERNLIALAFLMGSIGAISGMSIFKHKTKKLKFKVLIPIALIFNILILIVYLY